MALAAGHKLFHYEILGPLGSGGMGEVWRARDTKLEREVAIKVLPAELACDDGSLRRFEREARTLASLNHPNLAQVFGIDQAESTCFIAMELVPGTDLEERLERRPLRIEETLDVAIQIAAALEAAHEAGVVHRDLKPANVRCTPDGDVKVIDFGLAKPVAAETVAGSAFQTQDGHILGTPAYMAPEQLRGAPLDRRVDVWAFGCVLYECLSGKRAFAGESLSDVVAAVLGKTPDLDALPAGTPQRLRALIERCLRKDPRRRLRDIGDARIELEEIASDTATSDAPVPPRSRGLPLLVGAGAAFLAAGAFAGHRLAERPASPSFHALLSMQTPPGTVLDVATGLAPPLAVSPDGRHVAFAAQDADGVRRIHLRSVDDLEPRALAGTEGAEFPFFSADGKELGWAGYGGDGLWRVSLAGGSPRGIPVEGVGIRGVSWDARSRLVLGIFSRGLVLMPVAGGESVPLTTVGLDEDFHSWPQFLPDKKTVLFTAGLRDGHAEPRLVSLETGEITSLGLSGTVARYLPGGYLVYSRSDELIAVRFDLSSKRVVGDPVVVRAGMHVSVHGTPYFAVSEDGSLLVLEPSRGQPAGRKLLWVDREGNESPFVTGSGFEFPRLSPDGRKVAVAIHSETNTHEIWTIDVQRALESVVTKGGNDIEPTWLPDGDGIVFTSALDGNLYRIGLAAGATPGRLLERAETQLPLSCTPAGHLLFHENSESRRRWDLLELDLESGDVRSLVSASANERAGAVSPDGRSLAYVSDETGSPQIYLCSYPKIGPKERVTPRGGVEPVWSPLGGELFFRNGLGFYAVDVDIEAADPAERIGEPRLLFEGGYGLGFSERPNYDVTADAQRFIVVDEELGLTRGRLDVEIGFQNGLERLLPRGKVR